jgi:hypothetical protein
MTKPPPLDIIDDRPRPDASIKAQITKARSEVGALISLLSRDPSLKAAYREAKVAERTLQWVAEHVAAKRDEDHA